MQLKWIWPIAAFSFLSLNATNLSGLKFIPIYEALTIRAQKTAPPFVAFEESNLNLHSLYGFTDWARLETKTATTLLAGNNPAHRMLPLPVKKLVLAEMVITKKVETIYADLTSDEWRKGLSQSQQDRLIEAQAKSQVLDQDWSLSSWSDEVEKQLTSNGYEKQGSRYVATSAVGIPANKINVATTESGGKAIAGATMVPPGSNNSPIYVAATDSQGKTCTTVDEASVQSVPASERVNVSYVGNGEVYASNKIISGPIEITGGLAVTNEHYIEIRRTNEGIAKEVGRVDLQRGTYNINVDEALGSIDAKLVNKQGKILGEGSVRLARLDLSRTDITGPKLKIEPHDNFSGIVSNYQGNRVEKMAPAKATATLLKGVEDIKMARDGNITLEKMAKGSSTVLRAAAPSYMQTAAVVFAGEEFQAPLFPNSMIRALKEIVLNERQDVSKDEGLGAVVWGTALLDGKSVSGIQVQIESDEAKRAIYFDQFLLPDPKLTATSENGLYAFIDVEEGFQSLLATRGEAIFAYKNVIAENGSVALGNVESSIKIESVPLRIFDAFSGNPQAGKVSIQSMDQEVEVPNGSQVLLLPQVSRLGLIRSVPTNNEYLPARYLYNDKDAFIHLPLISWSWLSDIKTYLKVSDQPNVGIVVGFVPGEDFDVYLAGYDDFDLKNRVYFDVQGRILQKGKGIAGGGFILYNVPEDTHEIVVVGGKSQKIYSKVLPVDTDTLSILSYRE